MPFQRATIQNLSKGTAPVEVKFNPSEYSIQRNMSYAEVQIPGLETPVLQFVRGDAQTLSLELFLDASDRVAKGKPTPDSIDGSKGIDTDLGELRRLVTIDEDLHAPPVVELKWGTTKFQGVVTNYGEKFVLFDQEGAILRARVTLQLKSYTPAKIQLEKLNKQSPDRTKTRVVREGERIDVIAAEEYGDAAFWPAIARANNLARPRLLAPGTLLVIPPL
ncbi:MAG: hypothetical protein KF773_02495 [Deltaproteobacteria bacterium]|nr:hypothetical protein [Deltaproteobacteria bacterium]MCW5801155.1 hypothetical protein [Deltaproteobacteria bacterium]